MSQLLHYKILATATLDYLKAHFSKSIIVDGRSHIGEYYEQQQLLVEKYFQKKATGLLKKKFESLSGPLRKRGDQAFARYIAERTGQQLDVVSEAQEAFQQRAAKFLAKPVNEQRRSAGTNNGYEESPAIIAPDGRKRLHIVRGRSGQQMTSSVTIVFEQSSTGIYCKLGLDEELTAVWKDNDSILITSKKDDLPETTKYRQVQSFDELVTIEYAEG
ncbi:MAG: hypothetical protein J7578_12535 [Chitinophagaceae bacterium]|nr:hypothetical protein [Chitinophagaceae bacterium]